MTFEDASWAAPANGSHTRAPAKLHVPHHSQISRTLRAAPDPQASTVGVEEELFLVEPLSHEVCRCTDELLSSTDRLRLDGRVVGEMSDGVVEITSPVCANAAEAVDRLANLHAAILDCTNARLLGAGLHPTAPFGDVEHRRGSHYDAVSADTRGLLRQTAYCGVHVHVGMPDRETTIAACNGMRKWIPLLQALSANSPFWHGQDSGLASARTVVCHSVPRTGLPRVFRDWKDYEQTVAEIVRVSGADGLGSIWWDMRPHPTLGTLEIRCLDAQSSLSDLAGLVALVHCLVQHEAMTVDTSHPSGEVLQEATYLAIRDGLDARFSTGGAVHHVQLLARDAISLASGYARQLGCETQLSGLEQLLADGNGAVRQRRAYENGGMPGVLRRLVAETCDVEGVDQAA